MNEQKVSEELRPCPFCGAEPLEDRIEPHEHPPIILALTPLPYSYPGSWSVECVHCECRIFSHESREKAIARWNTRQSASGEIEALEAVQQDEIDRVKNGLGELYCKVMDADESILNPRDNIIGEALHLITELATLRHMAARMK